MSLKSIASLLGSNKISQALSVIGIYHLSKLTLKSILWAKKYFLPSSNNLQQKYGNGWVIITGGSEGIGLSFAGTFLEAGYKKILLISRSEQKLKSAQETLSSKHPDAEIKYLSFDFNKDYSSSDDVEELKKAISSACDDISILVNNVGTITREKLVDMPDDKIHAMINVNIFSLIFVTKIAIELTEKKDHKLLVIGSGSIAGTIRMQKRCIYGPSKTFMESFLECVDKEYENVDATCLIIGPVETELCKIEMPFKLKSKELTDSAINVVGKYRISAAHYKHDIYNKYYLSLPMWLKDYLLCGKSFE